MRVLHALIKNMKINLLPIDNVDIDLLQKWQNDINIKYPLMGFRFPIQKQSIKSWLEEIRIDNGKTKVVYGIFDDKNPLGMIALQNIDYINSNANYGIYLGNKTSFNKGIGFEATMILLDFAFNGMGLHRIGLEVLSSNKNAINLYKKIGFILEGTKKESYFLNGKFIDIEMMSILKTQIRFEKNILKNRLVLDL